LVAFENSGGAAPVSGPAKNVAPTFRFAEVTLQEIIDRARTEPKRLATPVQPPLDMTFWGRVKRWARG
jgi:hypothetical protein